MNTTRGTVFGCHQIWRLHFTWALTRWITLFPTILLLVRNCGSFFNCRATCNLMLLLMAASRKMIPTSSTGRSSTHLFTPSAQQIRFHHSQWCYSSALLSEKFDTVCCSTSAHSLIFFFDQVLVFSIFGIFIVDLQKRANRLEYLYYPHTCSLTCIFTILYTLLHASVHWSPTVSFPGIGVGTNTIVSAKSNWLYVCYSVCRPSHYLWTPTTYWLYVNMHHYIGW